MWLDNVLNSGQGLFVRCWNITLIHGTCGLMLVTLTMEDGGMLVFLLGLSSYLAYSMKVMFEKMYLISKLWYKDNDLMERISQMGVGVSQRPKNLILSG